MRPAINAGLSVSRVGGAAQTKLIKKLAGNIRLALAQYRELAAFSQFASDLDDATRKQLERGQRTAEIMKQKQYSPLSVAEMGLVLYAVQKGYFDDVPLVEVVRFERALLADFRSVHADLMNRINMACNYNDEVVEGMEQVIKQFKATQTW
jgi:F-type H+-transporting ATPase subunit alpha